MLMSWSLHIFDRYFTLSFSHGLLGDSEDDEAEETDQEPVSPSAELDVTSQTELAETEDEQPASSRMGFQRRRPD